MYHQPSDGELPLGLIHQVDAINDEIKFGNDLFKLEVVGQVVDVVKGESCFAAPLGMPDDPFLDAAINLLLYRLLFVHFFVLRRWLYPIQKQSLPKIHFL